MARTHRMFRLLPAILAVWCLGCDAFESVADWLIEPHAPASLVAAVAETSATAADDLSAASSRSVRAGVDAADVADACHCVLGHAAVASVAFTVSRPALAPADFADRPPALVLPAPEPLLRPPVA